jgi:PAS domain-containing protein
VEAVLEVVLGGEEHVENFSVEHEFEDIGRRIMLLNARRIAGEEAHPPLILLAIDDVTDLEQARFELEGQKRFAEAMIVTIRQPVLVLNAEMRVERANPAFYDLFNVTPEQTSSRLIYELGNQQWDIPALRRLLEAVMGGQEHIESYRVEHEFEDIGRRIMLLNARRIEGEDTRPHLVLLAINDITDLEQARFQLEGRKEYAEKIIDSVRESLIVLGWDLRVKHANKTFYELFQVRPEETQGKMIYDVGNRQWDIPRLRLLLEDILPQKHSFDDYEVEHDFETIGPRTMLLNARRLDHQELILLAIRDVTEKFRIEAQERAMIGELKHRVKNILANVRALFELSRRDSLSMEDFTTSFENRLASLEQDRAGHIDGHPRIGDQCSQVWGAVTRGRFDRGQLADRTK